MQRQDIHFHQTQLKQSCGEELLRSSIWVASDPNGVPYTSPTGLKANSADPQTWSDFTCVTQYCAANPGFLPAIALKGSDLCIIDLDDVRDDSGKIEPWAQEIIDALQSYTEVSRSGHGFHIVCSGQKPGRLCKAGQFEMYDGEESKFITLTGNTLDGLTKIRTISIEELSTIYEKHLKKQSSSIQIEKKSPPLLDEQIITLCSQEKCKEKFETLFFKGNISAYGHDDSAADLALVSIFAFFTQDPCQIFRLFQQSSLYKAHVRQLKWEREDYRTRTIEKAILGRKDYYQSPIQRILKSVGIGEFLRTKLPQKPLILDPILREQDIQLIYAPAGVGKTHLAMNMAYAISTGGSFLCFKAPSPRRVLYVDGEMPEIQLQERLASIFLGNKDKPVPDDTHFQLLISTGQEFGLPYLDDTRGQELLHPFFDRAEVIFLDNLSTLTAIAEQDAKTWLPIQELLVRLRRQGKTVVLIHHSGKNGDFRGTSRAIAILDTVIHLCHPKDYEMREGLRFEMRFQKARSVIGNAVDPLDIRANEKEGGFEWVWKKLEESVDEKIQDLLELGMKDHEIINDLGISRATYYRHKKKIGG